MFKFGMTWAALLCVLFLFEMTPAQAGDIDLSVVDCSVGKIPGTDSVLVTATLQYLVANAAGDSIQFRLSVMVNDSLVNSCHIYTAPFPNTWECDGGPKPCHLNTGCGLLLTSGGLLTGYCEEYWYLEELKCGCYYSDPHGFPLPLDELLISPGDTVTIVVDDTQLVQELDENNNVCSTIYTAADIPTLTEWGLIIFGVLLVGFITYVFLKRRKVIGVRL